MALNIKNAETVGLVQELAAETGESLTEAITVAVRERLDSMRRRQRRQEIVSSVREIQEFLRGVPDVDTRSADEILDYDAFGLPR